MDSTDLTLDDIEFLSAITRINGSNEYLDSEKSAVPADSATINSITNLSTEQINYRMGGQSNGRGFVEAGLIESYDPITNWGPRSAMLTETGREMLEEATRRTEEISGVERVEFEELEQKVEELNTLLTGVFGFDPISVDKDDETIAHCGAYILDELNDLSDKWEQTQQQQK